MASIVLLSTAVVALYDAHQSSGSKHDPSVVTVSKIADTVTGSLLALDKAVNELRAKPPADLVTTHPSEVTPHGTLDILWEQKTWKNKMLGLARDVGVKIQEPPGLTRDLSPEMEKALRIAEAKELLRLRSAANGLERASNDARLMSLLRPRGVAFKSDMKIYQAMFTNETDKLEKLWADAQPAERAALTSLEEALEAAEQEAIAVGKVAEHVP